MHSSVTMGGLRCGSNNSAVEAKLGATKLASATRGVLTLAVFSAQLLAAALQADGQTETVLYSFTGSPDGRNPYVMTPVLDRKGNLYGTTEYGGAYGFYGGTVFKLTPSGTETVLHSFNPGGGTDGVGPYGGLVRDAKGNLYGTTYGGGAYGAGTVFEVTPSGTETVLYSFNPGNGTDAENPYAGLVMDKKGNLYGTGGGGAYKYGAVFEVTPSGTETILYSFNGNGTDGYAPFGGLVLGKKGNLYGTTKYGGGSPLCGSGGCGTVFEITPSGKETILHNFGANSGDGVYPFAGVVRDKNGNLYGTTLAGGAQGNGVVFRLTPSGAETILYSFNPANGTDGYEPYGGLAIDKSGNLYGTTEVGGAHGYGTVYKVTP